MAKVTTDTAFNVEVVDETAKAQVAPPREPDSDEVKVHEVHVRVDEPVTDPSADNAVLVEGEGGEGSLDLPLHRYAEGEHVEDVYAREASEEE